MKLPNPKGYVNNVLKEMRDVGHSWNAAQEMSMKSGKGTDAEATRLRKIADKEQGQLAGAILQGRRYDSNGKQITDMSRKVGTIKPLKKAK